MSHKRQAKSAQWRRAQERDTHVRAARAQGYRSRAAFKLLEMDAQEKLLHHRARVVDLGCAPGSWLQVALQKTSGHVVGVDLLPMKPIKDVYFLQADFRKDETMTKMMALLNGHADVVLSDMAPNLSGIAVADQARAAELVRVAADFALQVLPPTGRFLVKAFHGDDFVSLLRDLKSQFTIVKVLHPQSSRVASREVYLLASDKRKA